jgi:hypothetical protein
MEVNDYIGTFFKAYDKTYNLGYEISINSDLKCKIIEFPINSYVYTENGYKMMFQGINVIPIFNLDKKFKVDINIKIQ